MTVRKGRGARLALALAAALVAGVVSTVPSIADTEGELREARQRLAALQADLNRLSAAYAEAASRLARTQARIGEVRGEIDRARGRMRRLRSALSERARDAYEAGGAGTLEALLASASFSEFSDRVEYLGRLAQQDGDLLLRARVGGERLRRYEQELSALSERQRDTVNALAAQKAAIAAAFQRTLEAKQALERKLEAERAAAREASAAAAAAAAPVASGGALRACPVGQPRAYSNDFGQPRSGGRSHQGNDILAPYGTPVYAAQSGRFEQTYNSLGGTSALVYAPNGDFTYYAHMSSYAGVANGATVSAGTMIGRVGTSGNAAGGPPHLHFEYHPGGGGATNPYPYLRAVCG